MDLRELGLRPSFPVASTAFAQLTYASGATGAGLTDTATLKINGVVEQMAKKSNSSLRLTNPQACLRQRFIPFLG